jgi:hypothetical protein
MHLNLLFKGIDISIIKYFKLESNKIIEDHKSSFTFELSNQVEKYC